MVEAKSPQLKKQRSTASVASSNGGGNKKRKMSQMTKDQAQQVEPAKKPSGKTRKLAKNATKSSNDEEKKSNKTMAWEEMTQRQRLMALTQFKGISVMDLALQVKKEVAELKTRKAGEPVICPICQCDMFEDVDYEDEGSIRVAQDKQDSGQVASDYIVLMQRCSDHFFHLECLEGQLGKKSFLDCSTCMVTYGVKTGDQPPGKMTWDKQSYNCAGEDSQTGTWEIQYSFPSGVNPESKQRFHGDGRTGFIPDTVEGREVLALLVRSFQRRLTFTVGFSVVRGRDNCIVWNGVHHKTNTSGGSTRYGYPDDTYFNRVKQELALKGVVFTSEQDKSSFVEEVTKELCQVKVDGYKKGKKSDQASFLNDFKIPGL